MSRGLAPRSGARDALLAAAAFAALAVALGGPRLTWQNTGLLIRHPAHQAAAALAGAALLGASGVAPPKRRGLLAAAILLAAVGADRLAFAVEAVDAGLRKRTLLGTSRVAWSEVEAVETGPSEIRVRDRGGAEITLSTRRLGGEDRGRLERTLARRVREAAP